MAKRWWSLFEATTKRTEPVELFFEPLVELDGRVQPQAAGFARQSAYRHARAHHVVVDASERFAQELHHRVETSVSASIIEHSPVASEVR